MGCTPYWRRVYWIPIFSALNAMQRTVQLVAATDIAHVFRIDLKDASLIFASILCVASPAVYLSGVLADKCGHIYIPRLLMALSLMLFILTTAAASLQIYPQIRDLLRLPKYEFSKSGSRIGLVNESVSSDTLMCILTKSRLVEMLHSLDSSRYEIPLYQVIVVNVSKASNVNFYLQNYYDNKLFNIDNGVFFSESKTETYFFCMSRLQDLRHVGYFLLVTVQIAACFSFLELGMITFESLRQKKILQLSGFKARGLTFNIIISEIFYKIPSVILMLKKFELAQESNLKDPSRIAYRSGLFIFCSMALMKLFSMADLCLSGKIRNAFGFTNMVCVSSEEIARGSHCRTGLFFCMVFIVGFFQMHSELYRSSYIQERRTMCISIAIQLSMSLLVLLLWKRVKRIFQYSFIIWYLVSSILAEALTISGEITRSGLIISSFFYGVNSSLGLILCLYYAIYYSFPMHGQDYRRSVPISTMRAHSATTVQLVVMIYFNLSRAFYFLAEGLVPQVIKHHTFTILLVVALLTAIWKYFTRDKRLRQLFL